jgi:hypothetical protein
MACTSVLGIDGDYVLGTRDSGLVSAGGSGTGGGAETGGAETGGAETGGGGTGSGGGPATGGIENTGGRSTGGSPSCDADGAACPSGQKCCPAPSDPSSKSCADPLPIVGCSARGCAPCPAPPADGIAVCATGQCDFECVNGTTRTGSQCEATGTGGAGGAGGSGTGGTPPTPPCKQGTCGGCGLIGPFPCCRSNMSCGCTYAPGAVCY